MTGNIGRAVGEVSVYPMPSRFSQSLSIRIDPSPLLEAPIDAAADAQWAQMCAQNPRLFNGPILAVSELSLENGVITCVRDTYKRIALRNALKLDVAILSVTTILEARDEAGTVHVFLGRRGALTRSYPGFWELGPAGGLDVPQTQRDVLGHADVMAQVNAELREETGIQELVHDGHAVAVVFDPVAGSYDIAVRTMLNRPIEELASSKSEQAWEYEDTQWIAWADIPGFLDRERMNVIGPTSELLAWIGQQSSPKHC